MKLLMAFLLSVFFISCSHHHKAPEHHHHQFDKKCAYEVGQNHYDIEGKEEYSIQHGNKTYYFSSLEKKEKFQKDLEANIKRAQANWKRKPSASNQR